MVDCQGLTVSKAPGTQSVVFGLLRQGVSVCPWFCGSVELALWTRLAPNSEIRLPLPPKYWDEKHGPPRPRGPPSFFFLEVGVTLTCWVKFFF